MMKHLKHLIAPVVLLILASCNGGGQKALQASVTLLHLPPSIKTAYLEEIRPTATYTIDTAAVDALKGTFSFTFFPTGSEGLYRIRLDDSTRILLSLDRNSVSVRGDYNHLDSLNIQGSSPSVELQRFLGSLNLGNRRLQDLRKQNRELEKIHSPDSILREVSDRIREQRHALLDTILQEAQTTTSPVNAVFALSILDTPASWQEGKPIFEGLEQRFPNNTLVQQTVDAYHRQLNNHGTGLAVTVGDMAPDIGYPDTAGRVVSLKNFRGKFVLVDFWASWCAPCREENPQLVKTWKTFQGPSFAIFGVSLDTKKSSWLDAIHHDHLTWTHISDLKGWNSAPAATYGVEAIPANFLVNPEGKVIATNLSGDSLALKLKQVLPR